MKPLDWPFYKWLMQGLLTSILTGVGFLVISFTIEYVKRFRKNRQAREQEIFLQRILCGEQVLEWSNGSVRARSRRQSLLGTSRSLPRGQQLFEQYKQAGGFLGVGQGYYSRLAEARRRLTESLQDRSSVVNVTRASKYAEPDIKTAHATSSTSVADELTSLEWDSGPFGLSTKNVAPIALPNYLSSSDVGSQDESVVNYISKPNRSVVGAVGGIKLWSTIQDNDGSHTLRELSPAVGEDLCSRALREHPYVAPYLRQDALQAAQKVERDGLQELKRNRKARSKRGPLNWVVKRSDQTMNPKAEDNPIKPGPRHVFVNNPSIASKQEPISIDTTIDKKLLESDVDCNGPSSSSFVDKNAMFGKPKPLTSASVVRPPKRVTKTKSEKSLEHIPEDKPCSSPKPVKTGKNVEQKNKVLAWHKKPANKVKKGTSNTSQSEKSNTSLSREGSICTRRDASNTSIRSLPSDRKDGPKKRSSSVGSCGSGLVLSGSKSHTNGITTKTPRKSRRDKRDVSPIHDSPKHGADTASENAQDPTFLGRKARSATTVAQEVRYDIVVKRQDTLQTELEKSSSSSVDYQITSFEEKIGMAYQFENKREDINAVQDTTFGRPTFDEENKDAVSSSISGYIRKLVFGDSVSQHETGCTSPYIGGACGASPPHSEDTEKCSDGKTKTASIRTLPTIEEVPGGCCSKTLNGDINVDDDMKTKYDNVSFVGESCVDQEMASDEEDGKQIIADNAARVSLEHEAYKTVISASNVSENETNKLQKTDTTNMVPKSDNELNTKPKYDNELDTKPKSENELETKEADAIPPISEKALKSSKRNSKSNLKGTKRKIKRKQTSSPQINEFYERSRTKSLSRLSSPTLCSPKPAHRKRSFSNQSHHTPPKDKTTGEGELQEKETIELKSSSMGSETKGNKRAFSNLRRSLSQCSNRSSRKSSPSGTKQEQRKLKRSLSRKSGTKIFKPKEELEGVHGKPSEQSLLGHRTERCTNKTDENHNVEDCVGKVVSIVDNLKDAQHVKNKRKSKPIWLNLKSRSKSPAAAKNKKLKVKATDQIKVNDKIKADKPKDSDKPKAIDKPKASDKPKGTDTIKSEITQSEQLNDISYKTNLETEPESSTTAKTFKNKNYDEMLAIKKAKRKSRLAASKMLDNYDIEVKREEVLGAVVSLVTYRPKNNTENSLKKSVDHSDNCIYDQKGSATSEITITDIEQSNGTSMKCNTLKRCVEKESKTTGHQHPGKSEVTERFREPRCVSSGSSTVESKQSGHDCSSIEFDTDSESELTYTSKYGRYSLRLHNADITSKRIDQFKSIVNASGEISANKPFSLRPSTLDKVVKSLGSPNESNNQAQIEHGANINPFELPEGYKPKDFKALNTEAMPGKTLTPDNNTHEESACDKLTSNIIEKATTDTKKDDKSLDSTQIKNTVKNTSTPNCQDLVDVSSVQASNRGRSKSPQKLEPRSRSASLSQGKNHAGPTCQVINKVKPSKIKRNSSNSPTKRHRLLSAKDKVIIVKSHDADNPKPGCTKLETTNANNTLSDKNNIEHLKPTQSNADKKMSPKHRVSESKKQSETCTKQSTSQMAKLQNSNMVGANKVDRESKVQKNSSEENNKGNSRVNSSKGLKIFSKGSNVQSKEAAGTDTFSRSKQGSDKTKMVKGRNKQSSSSKQSVLTNENAVLKQEDADYILAGINKEVSPDTLKDLASKKVKTSSRKVLSNRRSPVKLIELDSVHKKALLESIETVVKENTGSDTCTLTQNSLNPSNVVENEKEMSEDFESKEVCISSLPEPSSCKEEYKKLLKEPKFVLNLPKVEDKRTDIQQPSTFQTLTSNPIQFEVPKANQILSPFTNSLNQNPFGMIGSSKSKGQSLNMDNAKANNAMGGVAQTSTHVFGSNASFSLSSFQAASQPDSPSNQPEVKVSNYRLNGDGFRKYRQQRKISEDDD